RTWMQRDVAMIPPHDDSTLLSSDAWDVREDVLRRFERAWRAGGHPAIDDYLPAGGGTGRRPALVGAVHTDLEYRLRAGEPAGVEEYLRRYPWLRDHETVASELLAAERDLRLRFAPSARNGDGEASTGSRDRLLPGPRRLGKYDLLEAVG